MAMIHGPEEVLETRCAQADIQTRDTVRVLTLRGFAATEATNLTAYLCGIAVGDGGWKLGEINGLLFLRDLSRRGRFGPTDASRTASRSLTGSARPGRVRALTELR
jgi:hypothetical protein